MSSRATSWNSTDTPSSLQWSSSHLQSNRHYTSAADAEAFRQPPSLAEPHAFQMPPMTRMQTFSAMADLELARMNDTEAETVPGYHPLGPADHQLRVALGRLLRAETTFDFAATVKDVDAATLAPVPAAEEASAVGQVAMEVVGYVGVTGKREPEHDPHEGASTASWDWE
ncbi:uncharacterized protein LOC117650826 [Thrips palmi]|uniref:Uncharacterized protein LOC117650826 n=1 Tax=Thrips palmi TaxID=161013 RepID=A0A6P8ZYW1_THRPL|nr:uncharacterized protein LOC117650826 [Thrips palmi]